MTSNKTPEAQTSTLGGLNVTFLSFFIVSGAIYTGVPMWAVLRPTPVHVLANPKSVSFSTGGSDPSRSTLSSLRSRWATQFLWQ